ncbi:unnamed protein product [Penicillium nalgiovense]|nr:unnamed protein product [Penicillium nalgiovense]
MAVKESYDRWTQRPPYRIIAPDDFGEVQWRAHCQCGQVEYLINRAKPLMSKFCHCRGCQVLHDIMFTKGATGLSFYSSQHATTEYKTPTKVACNFCRTPIMDEGNNVCLIFPELISVEGSHDEQKHRREAFYPKCHIFYKQRLVDILDDLPKWSEMDEESEILDRYGRKRNDI